MSTEASAPEGRDAFLADHFRDHGHQLRTARLGMWLFLGLELLLFAGVLAAYAVFRSTHPAAFAQGARLLEATTGAAYTSLLIVGSASAAWSLRSLQLGHRGRLMLGMGGALACALACLGVRGLEIARAVGNGLLWGARFAPRAELLDQALRGAPPADALPVFFSLHFVLTGLHAVMIAAAAVAYLWLSSRAVAGHFDPRHRGPVELAALHWHLLAVLGIVLFPLLYLVPRG